MKRFFDLTFSLAMFVFLSPLLIAVSLLIVVFDGRPVIFSQFRVGLEGKKFLLYKFRSMSVEPKAVFGTFDVGHSTRVTRFGKILRKTKIDELPQLWNVILGDMSIVGPRPEVRKWVDYNPNRWLKIHSVRPGITDPASIYFRNEEKTLSLSTDPENAYKEEVLPKKLDFYDDYVNSHSFSSDLKIIFQTFLALFR